MIGLVFVFGFLFGAIVCGLAVYIILKFTEEI